jgi:hypothetical protein
MHQRAQISLVTYSWNVSPTNLWGLNIYYSYFLGNSKSNTSAVVVPPPTRLFIYLLLILLILLLGNDNN